MNTGVHCTVGFDVGESTVPGRRPRVASLGELDSFAETRRRRLDGDWDSGTVTGQWAHPSLVAESSDCHPPLGEKSVGKRMLRAGRIADVGWDHKVAWMMRVLPVSRVVGLEKGLAAVRRGEEGRRGKGGGWKRATKNCLRATIKTYFCLFRGVPEFHHSNFKHPRSPSQSLHTFTHIQHIHKSITGITGRARSPQTQ